MLYGLIGLGIGLQWNEDLKLIDRSNREPGFRRLVTVLGGVFWPATLLFFYLPLLLDENYYVE